MSDSVPIDQERQEHRTIVDPVGMISEILSNIDDQRDVIRELLSNASAKEVGAKKVDIRVYESDKGLSFTIEDDGIGMGYTQDPNNPGRLDKFLNLAQGRQAGFSSDEFGAKGLGSILLYNSRSVEIQTWDGGKKYHRVVLHEPRTTILEQKKMVKPTVYSIVADGDPSAKRGTKITVLGWNDKKSIPKEFRLSEIERYLKYRTVAGYTRLDGRNEPLPEFNLSVGAETKELKAGFPYIIADEKSDDARTVTFGPIKISKKTPKGKEVSIVLKGGVTIDTSKFNLSDLTGGVWLSVNGIPYFKLYTNKYAKKLNLTDDFMRFVVECDNVRLNTSRGDINYDDNFEAFEDALQDAFNQIKDDPKFQRFYENKYREIRIKLQQYMTQQKEAFFSADKRYVWYNGQMMLGEPQGEYDVAALLWKLEGMKATPFEQFQTLQYPGYSQGIDLLINIQEEKDSEMVRCAYAELEKTFSNLIRHKHDISQMTFAFCWKVDKPRVRMGNVDATKKAFKHVYTYSDSHITVFEISSFPGIFVGTKKDADEHFSPK